MSAPEHDGGLWGAIIVSGLGIIGGAWKWISSRASKNELAAAINAVTGTHTAMRDEIAELREDVRTSAEEGQERGQDIREALNNVALKVASLEGEINGGHERHGR